jgi:hypothetical protein
VEECCWNVRVAVITALIVSLAFDCLKLDDACDVRCPRDYYGECCVLEGPMCNEVLVRLANFLGTMWLVHTSWWLLVTVCKCPCYGERILPDM